MDDEQRTAYSGAEATPAQDCIEELIDVGRILDCASRASIRCASKGRRCRSAASATATSSLRTRRCGPRTARWRSPSCRAASAWRCSKSGAARGWKKPKVEQKTALAPAAKRKPVARAKAALAERPREIAAVGSGQLGASIVAARHAAGLTQVALADKLGASHANLIRLEKGRSIPTATTLQKIAAGTGHQLEIRFRKQGK